jgi:hypothetical protein
MGRLALPRLLLISRLLQKDRQSGEDEDDKFSLPTSSGLSENVFEGCARRFISDAEFGRSGP